ncbi:MAG: aldo/keto reductase [Anaeroplasma sp.]|nr:aldo/keto reductase [Anaeroplasma sp.]
MQYVVLEGETFPAIALGTSGWDDATHSKNALIGKIFGKTQEKNVGIEKAEEVFRKGVELGYTLWDTAAIYGDGASEKILGQLQQKTLQKVSVSTKYTPRGMEAKKRLYKVFEESRKHLCKDCMDIYWIHNASNVRKWIKAVVPLVKEGKIRHIGVANHSLEQICQAQKLLEKEGLKLAAVQDHFSLLYQKVKREGILSWCQENEAAFFGYFVLEQGVFDGTEQSMYHFAEQMKLYGGKKKEILSGLVGLHEKLDGLSSKYGVHKEALALNYVLREGVLPVVEVSGESELQITEQALRVQAEEWGYKELEEYAGKVEGSWL